MITSTDLTATHTPRAHEEHPMTRHQHAAQQLATAIAHLRIIERDQRAGLPVAAHRVDQAHRDVAHFRAVYAALGDLAGTPA